MADDTTQEETHDDQGDAQSATDQGDAAPPDLGDAGKQAIDRMKAERDTARREARINAQAATRLRELEDSQKTETQRLQDQLAAVSRERDDARVDATRVRLGLRYKLDETDLDFLGAGSDEDMEGRAKRLAERVQAARPPSFDGGARKSADTPTDMNSYVRRLAGKQ